jgi:hypothetical protein
MNLTSADAVLFSVHTWSKNLRRKILKISRLNNNNKMLLVYEAGPNISYAPPPMYFFFHLFVTGISCVSLCLLLEQDSGHGVIFVSSSTGVTSQYDTMTHCQI